MKVKSSVIVSEIDDAYILVDADPSKDRFNGMIRLNLTSKRIIELLRDDISLDELVTKLLEIYNVQEEVIRKDLSQVLDKLKSVNLLENA